MALAVATSIPPSVWAAEDERAIITAIQILKEQEKQQEAAARGKHRASGAEGPQYSG